jgi:hypothetical protein
MNEPTDTKQKDDDQIIGKAKALFDAVGPWLRWLPATGIAAAALLAVMVMRGPDGVETIAGPATASDFEMLLEEDSLDMLEELEFYYWLEASDLEANGNVG